MRFVALMLACCCCDCCRCCRCCRCWWTRNLSWTEELGQVPDQLQVAARALPQALAMRRDFALAPMLPPHLRSIAATLPVLLQGASHLEGWTTARPTGNEPEWTRAGRMFRAQAIARGPLLLAGQGARWQWQAAGGHRVCEEGHRAGQRRVAKEDYILSLPHASEPGIHFPGPFGRCSEAAGSRVQQAHKNPAVRGAVVWMAMAMLIRLFWEHSPS